MEMIKIPHTDLEVSRLAMGCMGLGGGWGSGTQLTADHERQAREFLDAAEEIGVNFFDHANIYGRGRSEEVFGRVLKDRPSLRDKIVIQSKCGIRWADDPPGTRQRYDFSREHGEREIPGGLEALADAGGDGKTAWFVIYTPHTGASFINADPRESPALQILLALETVENWRRVERLTFDRVENIHPGHERSPG
jgi:hypothetical protein